jgi:hypothetical protein
LNLKIFHSQLWLVLVCVTQICITFCHLVVI